MRDTLFHLLGIYVLLIAPVGFALIWRQISGISAVKKLLGWGALLCGTLLTAAYANAIVIGASCSGNAAAGYANCTVFSDQFSNAYTQIFLMLLLALILVGLVLFCICGVFEIRAYKRRKI